MSKAVEEYEQRMGYMPSFGIPQKLDEDGEFEYYEVKVPRQYIKEHLELGETWPHEVDTSIKGTQDDSIVLGVMFIPVYSGVDYLREDDDFLFYKVRVPKVFLDAPILGSEMTYRTVYEKGDRNVETSEQKAERESEHIECKKAPKAGVSLDGKEELMIVRKVKEATPLLYEVTFKCKNKECAEEFEEVGSDLFDLLYSRCCGSCAGVQLEVISCKTIYGEEEDE
jgi:hypothetical protein